MLAKNCRARAETTDAKGFSAGRRQEEEVRCFGAVSSGLYTCEGTNRGELSKSQSATATAEEGIRT